MPCCEKERESYAHLFVLHEKVEPLWTQLEQWMKKLSQEAIDFSVPTVIWNILIENKPSHVKNLLQNMVKYIATRNNKLHKHYRKWHGVEDQQSLQHTQ